MYRLMMIGFVTFLSGCSTTYMLTLERNSDITAYPYLNTTDHDGVSVSIGSLIENTYTVGWGVGLFIENNTNHDVSIKPSDISVFVNGKSAAFHPVTYIEKYRKMENITAALNAGTAAFNRSIQGGYGMSTAEYNYHRTDMGSYLYETITNALEEQKTFAIKEGVKRARLTARDIEDFWDSSVLFRFNLARYFQPAEKYYLTDMVLKPGEVTFRILWLDHDSVYERTPETRKYSPVEVRANVNFVQSRTTFWLNSSTLPDSKSHWMSDVRADMVWGTCNGKHEFMRCYDIDLTNCRTTIDALTSECAERLGETIPQEISNSSKPELWQKMSMCVGAAFENSMNGKRRSDCDSERQGK